MKTALTILLSLVSFSLLAQLAQVHPKGGKGWCYINTNGETVIEAEFKKCGPFGSDGYAWVYDKKAKSHYFIDTSGARLKTEVEKFKLRNAFGFGTQGFNDGMAVIEVGEKWGAINADGKLKVKPKYTEASVIDGGYFTASRDGAWYVVNERGLEAKLEKVEDAYQFSEGLAAVRVDGAMGFANEFGKIVIYPKYKSVGIFSDGLCWVKDWQGMVGYIDKTGKPIIERQYLAGKNFSDGMARVRHGDDWVFIDPSGTRINVEGSNKIGDFTEGLAYAWKDDLVGFVNKKGEWVIEPKYEHVRTFHNGLAAVKIGKYWGYIDTTGQLVIDAVYENVKDFQPIE